MNDLREKQVLPVVNQCVPQPLIAVQEAGHIGYSYKDMDYPEQLKTIEEQIRKADPANSGLWLICAESMLFIVSNEELLKAAGCRSEHQYISQAMNRLGLHPETARQYMKALRTYRNYEPYFRSHDMDIGANRDRLVKAGLYTKLLYLEQAINVKHRRIDATCSMAEVFGHFFNDSLREFKLFIDPDLSKRERWRDNLKLRNITIQKAYEKNEQVHLVSYVPTKSLDKDRLQAIIDAALKEDNEC